MVSLIFHLYFDLRVCVLYIYLRKGRCVIVVVCLSVCLLLTLRKKNFPTDLHESFRDCWQWLNFGGDPDHRLDTGIVFRIRHYSEIRKVVNGHKSAAHTDSPDGGTGKTF